MMFFNKMLVGGVAVIATVSLIGCKDDDDDNKGACSGFTGVTGTGDFDDCFTCIAGKLDYTCGDDQTATECYASIVTAAAGDTDKLLAIATAQKDCGGADPA